MIPASHPLAAVDGAFNAVFVEAEAAGQLMFYGQGAGGAPTASAVLGDLVAVARNRVIGGRGPRESTYASLPVRPMGTVSTRYHVSLDVADRAGVLAAIAGEFARNGVSIAAVRQTGGGARTATAPPGWWSSPTRRRRRRSRPPSRPCRAGRRARRGQRAARRGPGPDGGGRVTGASRLAAAAVRSWPGVIAAYRDRMPVPPGWQVVTLGEGGTPLLPAPELSRRTGCQVYLKVDGANPTGSFKDRGMTMAVTDALAAGKQGVICASTGNTSASAAAYAARAGLTCAVLVPRGKIALGKLAQAVAHGARILQIDGNFDDCLELARKTAADYPVAALVNSVNPTRIAGQASAAYEICDELGRAPDVHCLPVGNAGNITAYWAGYRAYLADGLIAPAPRMFGFQAAGAAPLVHGAAGAAPGDDRHRDPDRRSGLLGRGHHSP